MFPIESYYCDTSVKHINRFMGDVYEVSFLTYFSSMVMVMAEAVWSYFNVRFRLSPLLFLSIYPRRWMSIPIPVDMDQCLERFPVVKHMLQ